MFTHLGTKWSYNIHLTPKRLVVSWLCWYVLFATENFFNLPMLLGYFESTRIYSKLSWKLPNSKVFSQCDVFIKIVLKYSSSKSSCHVSSFYCLVSCLLVVLFLCLHFFIATLLHFSPLGTPFSYVHCFRIVFIDYAPLFCPCLLHFCCIFLINLFFLVSSAFLVYAPFLLCILFHGFHFLSFFLGFYTMAFFFASSSVGVGSPLIASVFGVVASCVLDGLSCCTVLILSSYLSNVLVPILLVLSLLHVSTSFNEVTFGTYFLL